MRYPIVLILALLLSGCAASVSVQTNYTESDDEHALPMVTTATDEFYYGDYWVTLTFAIPIP